VLEITMHHVGRPGDLAGQVAMLLAGVALNGLAIGLYIGARLGPGPRDGLMMGLARMGIPLRVARTGIELTVLAIGAVLGGRIGVGTLVYALGIGPLAHFFLPRLTVPVDGRRDRLRGLEHEPGGLDVGHGPPIARRPLQRRDGLERRPQRQHDAV
jgi:uncharacterized membrane protein YczE